MNIKYNLIILLFSALLFTGCNGKEQVIENKNNSIPVVVQKVSNITVSREIAVSGNIEGNKTIRLGFMVAGKLNYISAEEGSPIQANQLLASLDPENYSIAKDIADANLDQTQDEYNRLSQMFNRKSISESDFSKITNALKVAKAQQRLQAKNLTDTKLYSPISGILLKRGAEVGEIINTGMPLFVISDISKVKVNASVPESELHLIQIGNEAKIHVSSLDSTFIGKIVEIGSVAEETTRSFSVKVELKNSQLLIRPGMTAELQFKTNQTEQHPSIPAEAVLHDIDNSSYVYVMDSIKNQAFKRSVSLGNISDNQVEVISGLNLGESVVISGQYKLSNGSFITLK